MNYPYHIVALFLFKKTKTFLEYMSGYGSHPLVIYIFMYLLSTFILDTSECWDERGKKTRLLAHQSVVNDTTSNF
jgi:hypothetical protein